MSRKRIWTSTIVLLVIAFAGVFMINVDQTSAGSGFTTSVQPDANVSLSTEKNIDEAFGGSVMPAMLKMISALVVVVFCIYVGLYLLKRLTGGRSSGNGSTKILEVLETTYVAPKRTISLVRVADKSVLVGVTDTQISVLTELDADDTTAILAREKETTSVANEGFRKLLGSASEKIRKVTIKRNQTILET